MTTSRLHIKRSNDLNPESFLWHVWYHLIATERGVNVDHDALAIIRDAIDAIQDAKFYW